MRILFLGETFRADAISWYKGIETVSGYEVDKMELAVYPKRSLRIFFGFFFMFKCLSTFFSKPYDIVLAERSTSYGFFSLFINCKVRIVAQQGITDIFPRTFWSVFFKSILQRIVYSNVDLIHAWGPAMVYGIINSNAHPSKIKVLPKGLNLNVYKFQEHQISNIHAIVTRSFEKYYRHCDIIKAVAILKSRGVNIVVTMVGGGSLLDEMINLAIELNVQQNVIFTGRIDNTELPPLLQRSTLYLSVPVTEGVSSSLMEAMASGCLPIVTDLPGNRIFIKPNQNGELVDVANPDDLANKIDYVLKNYDGYKNGIKNNRDWIERNLTYL